MLDIQKETTKEEKDILEKLTTDWRTIVGELIIHYTTLGKPFSSGEISAKLRTFRTDLVFSSSTLGEYIRDSFQSCLFDLHRFMRFDRHTSSGQLVFVYAPNKWSGDSYDFEVDIPSPLNLKQTTSPVWTSKQNTSSITPSPSSTQDDVEVRVSKDGRLCFGKNLVKRIKDKLKHHNMMKNTPISYVSDTYSTLGIKFVEYYSVSSPSTKLVEADGRLRIPFHGSSSLKGSVFTVPFKTLFK